MARDPTQTADDAPIDHQEVLRQWSAMQLGGFKTMSPYDRLAVLKSGALQDWTETDRSAALEMFGGPNAVKPISPGSLRARPFGKPHTRQPNPPRRLPVPRACMVAASGWLLIMLVTTAQAFTLF